MILLSGRAYNDGIDFLVRNNYEKFFIRAQKVGGKIVVKREEYKNKRYEINKTWFIVFSIIWAILLSFLVINLNNIPINNNLIISAVLWLLLMSFLMINIRCNRQKLKYHAVEHKIFHYYEKNNKVPTNISDIVDENSLHIACGSMGITILFILATIALVALTLNMHFFLKILLILTGLLITVVLWIYDKLFFLQKLTIAEPSLEECELGIEAMKFFLELKEDIRRQSP